MFSIFGIAFAAIFLGSFLAFVATRKKPPQGISVDMIEDDLKQDDPSVKPLSMEDLYRVGEELCKENSLKIKEKMTISPEETYWVTESTNEFFFGNYVLGFRSQKSNEEPVSLSTLFEFKDFIKSVSSTKGFYFTNGFFSRHVHQPLEGPKVGLYNRLKVLAEMKRFGIQG